MPAFNVRLNNKTIDTVFYSMGKATIAQACDDVKRSLINHDGYDPQITVMWPRGQRVTRDYWELQGNYGYGHGWECLTASEKRSEVIADRKSYRENAPCPMRIVRKRERIS